MTSLMRRALLTLTLLVVAICAAIGGGQIVARSPHRALAIDALPRVQHQQVCAEDAGAGQALHHAGVVIVFPDGMDTYCVSFDEDELSGAELLQRTGLQLVLSGFGGLGSGVCRIDAVGCSDPGDCFCQCRGADCHYWTYFRLDSAKWGIQNIGASQRRVHDGDVDGWVWGNGHTPPGASTVGSICSAVRPPPLPTATPVPTNGTAATSTPAGPNGGNGAQQPTIVVTPAALTPMRATVAANSTATPEPRVVRQSSRPTSEVANAQRDASRGDGGGRFPAGLMAFGVVAAGLVVIAGGVVLRRRLSG